MSSTLRQRWRALFAILGLATLAACGPDSDGLVDVGPAPQMPASLAAQHQANLDAIERARRESAARYDELVAAWAARRSGVRPAYAGASGNPFVPCAPLQFDGKAQVVDSKGGTFNFGPHTLEVPKGALNQKVSIGVMVVSDLITRVELLPHGLTFAQPVQLTLAYGSCEQSSSHRVAYINSSYSILEWTSSVDQPAGQKVQASLTHFSVYAVAY